MVMLFCKIENRKVGAEVGGVKEDGFCFDGVSLKFPREIYSAVSRRQKWGPGIESGLPVFLQK